MEANESCLINAVRVAHCFQLLGRSNSGSGSGGNPRSRGRAETSPSDLVARPHRGSGRVRGQWITYGRIGFSFPVTGQTPGMHTYWWRWSTSVGDSSFSFALIKHRINCSALLETWPWALGLNTIKGLVCVAIAQLIGRSACLLKKRSGRVRRRRSE